MSPMAATPWRIWVDTGGTFTDCLAVDAEGRTHRAKVLSSSALRGTVAEVLTDGRLRLDLGLDLADGLLRGARFRLLGRPAEGVDVVRSDPGGVVALDPGPPDGTDAGCPCELAAAVEAPVLAAHLVTGTPLDRPLPTLAMRLATTRGTNALLEGQGAPTLLCITRGLGDLLAIGTQQRPDLFALDVRRPPPLYAAVLEVRERLAADGTVLEPLDEEAARTAAERLADGGLRCAAVALLHAFRNPAHEARVAEILRGAGFEHVSCSAELAPLIGILPRAETAVVDATLSPVVGGYLGRVREACSGGRVHVMTSAGGLVGAEAFRPKDALLSGPAGGVVGAAAAARHSGLERVVAFDMGGTSTDVARWDGEYEYVFSHRVGDAHLVAPALAIESVAAGGGSICAFRAGRLEVGPRSAGADPGPACYGAGGPLTVTDVNLLLGRLIPERFGIPVDAGAARVRLEELRSDVEGADGRRPDAEPLLEGLLQLADERMASAIRRISVGRGYDPSGFALVAFGGAGPQHACAVAALLGIERVLIPPDASLLSAAGLGRAVVERFAQRQVLRRLTEVREDLGGLFGRLEAEAREAVAAEGAEPADVVVRRRLAGMRLEGQDTSLEVAWRDGVDLEQAFARAYHGLYGYRPPERPVEVESLRVVASTRPARSRVAAQPPPSTASPAADHRMCLGGRWRRVPVYERPSLEAGAALTGPALVVEAHSTTVIGEGWGARVDGVGAMLLGRGEAGDGD